MSMTAGDLRNARHNLNISQEKLARALDISSKTISRYESGHLDENGYPLHPIPKVVQYAITHLLKSDYKAYMRPTSRIRGV